MSLDSEGIADFLTDNFKYLRKKRNPITVIFKAEEKPSFNQIVIEVIVGSSVLATSIDFEYLNKSISVESAEAELIKCFEELFIRNVYNQALLIGKYPFTRIWSDLSLETYQLAFNNTVEVPGWVHNKYRTRSNTTLFVKENYEDGELNITFNRIIKLQESSAVSSANLIASTEAIKESEEVSKKVVRRAPIKGFDPSKVKAPTCKDHNTEMIYDPVEMKWKCGITGCNLVARPKRDGDDKTVIIGKGGVQLRLIFHEGERHVMMISDDNVALNITPFVDIDGLIDAFDVMDAANVASDNGKSEFTITSDHSVPMKMRLSVMGADKI